MTILLATSTSDGYSHITHRNCPVIKDTYLLVEDDNSIFLCTDEIDDDCGLVLSESKIALN